MHSGKQGKAERDFCENFNVFRYAQAQEILLFPSKNWNSFQNNINSLQNKVKNLDMSSKRGNDIGRVKRKKLVLDREKP